MNDEHPTHDQSSAGAMNRDDSLRQQAEREYAARQKSDGTALSQAESTHLLHELQVHQIELEMQNEELRKVQEALAASQARYFDLFDLAPVGYITLNEKGLILEANLAAATMLGATRQTAVKQRLTQYIFAEDQDTYYLKRRQLHKLNKAQQCTVRIHQPDAEVHWVQLSMLLVGSGGNDSPVIRIVLVDVTERRMAEEALQNQQANLRALTENTDGSIWSIDTEYRLITGNSVFHQDIRAETGQVFAVGESVLTLKRFGDNNEVWRRHYDRALRGEQFRVEVRRSYLKPADWMEYRFSPIHNSAEEITGVSIYGRNITEHKLAEATLRQSEERFRLAFENANDRVCLVGLDGQLLRVNTRMCEIFGYNQQEMERLNIQDFTHPDSANVSPQFINRAVQEHKDHDAFDKRYQHRDGHLIWGHVSSSLVRDDQDEPLYFISHVQDITERKVAVEALTRSEANLQALIESTEDIIASRDRTGRLITFNTGFAKYLEDMFGAKAQVGESVTDILTKEQQAHWEELLAKVHAGGTHKEDFAISIGDDTHYFEMSLYPIWADGEVVGSTEFTRNITERKRREEALEQSQQNLTRAQQIGHLGSWEWDLQKDMLYWSDELYHIFGVEQDFALSYATIEAMIHPEDRLKNNAIVQEALTTADTVDSEFRIIRPDDKVRHIEQNIVVMRDGTGAPTKLVGIMQDITERKQAEESQSHLRDQLAQAQKMETVGRLAGGIAHDFNNMLAVIQLRAEMALQLVDPDSPLHRNLRAVQITALRSAKLIRQLLGFARKQTIAPKVLDLNAAVESTLPMLQKLIGEEIEQVRLPGAGLWPVKIDTSQLDQVLANLCVNARDAIDGVGTIRIETRNVNLDHAVSASGLDIVSGDYVMLVITDDGRGMDKQLLGHIFEPFFTSKEVGKGTGLGLATVEGIVLQNRGHIQVDSEPGIGTTFRIFLPRYADDVSIAAETGPALARKGNGEVVLLVEDEAEVLEIGADALRSLGYNVITASGPGEALGIAKLHSETIHLLVTDVIMPEMNGRALAEQIAALQPAIKCLYVSGYPADFIAHRGILEAGVHLLQKPFSLDSLAAKVSEMLFE